MASDSGYTKMIGILADEEQFDGVRIIRSNDAVKQATAKAVQLTAQPLAFARKQLRLAVLSADAIPPM